MTWTAIKPDCLVNSALGQNVLRGKAPVVQGATQVALSFAAPSADYEISAIANWTTTCEVVQGSQNANGITIAFSVPAGPSAEVQWIVAF